MSAQTRWTNRLLNELSKITTLAAGTVYAIPIDANVQNILAARYSNQVNDYYAQLKYYAYYDGNAKLLDDVEAAGIYIERLEALGPWKPLLTQKVPMANIVLLGNYAASFVPDSSSHGSTLILSTHQATDQTPLSNPHS